MALSTGQYLNSEKFKTNVHTTYWKESITNQLQSRKAVEQTPFEEICSFANDMFDKVEVYKSENIRLNLQREQLQQQLLGIQQTILAGGSDAAKSIISRLSKAGLNDDKSEQSNVASSAAAKSVDIQHASLLAEKSKLEKRILDLQEKLTDVLKSKSDTVQEMVDLRTQLGEKDNANRHLTLVLEQRDKEVIELKEALDKLKSKYTTLTDEHLALTLSYQSLDKRHHALKLECDAMSMQILAHKREEAERLNADNERDIRMRREKNRREIEANVANMNKELAARHASGDLSAMAADNFESIGDEEEYRYTNLPSKIPTTPEFTFEAHDGGSTAVRWYSCSGPKDSFLATGGQDRKVKIWKIADGTNTLVYEPLLGSNSSITSIDVEVGVLLASSSDMATRVWSLNSKRLNLTLTGHSAKVHSAKFLGVPNKIVSGSADRTIKLWDVNQGACSATFFAASSCTDLAYGNNHLISSHLDKRIKGWDLTRPDDNSHPAWFVTIGDSKVISVDISKDGTKVACCSRDNTIKCVDIRTLAVLNTYLDEKFRTGDEMRISFSNDDQYITCGSVDGSFFIWNVNTAKVKKVLKNHSNRVLGAQWSPDGERMVSIESGKKVTIWV